MTRVLYGQGTPLWRKGIQRMGVTNYNDEEIKYEVYKVKSRCII